MNTSLKKTVFEYAKLSSAHFIFLTSIIPLTGAIAMGEKNLFLLTILFLLVYLPMSSDLLLIIISTSRSTAS